jgi:hypothetical protein
MKAVLRDRKGWSKVMTIPHAMPEIRIPLHRKHVTVYEQVHSTYVVRDKDVELVTFKYTSKGLNDALYYDEYVAGEDKA